VRLRTLYWKVASLLANHGACCWVAPGRWATRSACWPSLLMVLSLVIWWTLNEELARPAALAPPAADGAHLAAGRSACSPAGGGPERLALSLPCGGN